MPHRPRWFKDGVVVASNSPTCGINKDGHELFVVDKDTGARSGEIDNKLDEDVQHIANGRVGHGTSFERPLADILRSRVLVPQYHDLSSIASMETAFKTSKDFELMTLGEAAKSGWIAVLHGHGSPSDDQRVGSVPYIKVSDIRAGQVNINPTNLVPLELARKYWGAETSGLEAYDLISPERASKNIGEFAVLMPGQEQVLLTKEVIIIRGKKPSLFDQFYMMWALTLEHVRDQWRRIVLMQTNREDVGDRLYEILIPFPRDRDAGVAASAAFREYFLSLKAARVTFAEALRKTEFRHHMFLE